jgi:hypothetical protein
MTSISQYKSWLDIGWWVEAVIQGSAVHFSSDSDKELHDS